MEEKKITPELDEELEQARRNQCMIDEQLDEIRKLDPKVESLAALAEEADTGEEFQRLVREHDLSFLQAYQLTHLAGLTQLAAERERARILRNLRSKQHLLPTKPQGKGAASVPREQLELFRFLMPQESDAAFRAYYNRGK